MEFYSSTLDESLLFLSTFAWQLISSLAITSLNRKFRENRDDNSEGNRRTWQRPLKRSPNGDRRTDECSISTVFLKTPAKQSSKWLQVGRKRERDIGIRGRERDGRKLANWLAVVIQFKTDPVEEIRRSVQTRGCLAKCSCVHDGTQMAHASFLPVLYYFLLALVTPMRTEGTWGEGEGATCAERHR